MKQATFYHAGCPVCVEAEREVANAVDRGRYHLDIAHLGEDKTKIAQAETLGVKSVPALVIDGSVFHINFGASLDALK